MSEDKPDLAAVLDHYGAVYDPMKMSQKILCPVHEEHVKSCSIDLDGQWFNCHACNAKGDSWNLIMAKEECDFATAVQKSEGITGVSSGHLRTAGDTGTCGLFGRTRTGCRDGGHKPFRPSLRAVERS